MSQWQPLPIVGGSYRDETRPWSYQDTINFIPVTAEQQGTRTSATLRCAPGFSAFSASAQSAPCRGLHNVEGTLYGVIGDKLYTWALDGTATSVGSIPGVERVSMAHNQIAGGNQLAIAANNSGYVYDTVAGTLTQITDDGFPGALYFAFIDSYIVGVDPSRNFIFNSSLADAFSYNTLDRAQAEAQPDKLTGIAVTHDELWVFGERTIQPFTDTGAAQAPFESNSNTVLEVGCASGHTIANMDNSLFWLGNDGIVYRANGYTPLRVSTHPVEQAISRCNRNAAFAFTFEDRGHKVYYLTFPDGETWGFDAASGEWHRRKSYGMDRWRIADLVYWNGHWIGGDYVNGKLYSLSWDCQQEDGRILERRRIFGPITENENAIIVNGLRLVADVGEDSGSALSANNLLNGPLVISGDLPSGATGVAVNFTYGMKGGVKPYGALSVTSGALPTGLSMDARGHVTGTVTAGGPYAWTVGATDATGAPASLNDSASFYTPATFDPLRNNNGTLSAGNTVVTQTVAASTGTDANTQKTSGKWYLEFSVLAAASVPAVVQAIVAASAGIVTNNQGASPAAFQWTADGSYYTGGTYHASGLSGWNVVGKTIGIAFDAATRKVWVRDASGWLLGGDPAANLSPIATLSDGGVGVCTGISFVYAGPGQNPSVKINAGQTSLAYPVPAGFSPLSTP